MNQANQDTPILDVRSEADYCECHRIGTGNIPLEELADRVHELPPPYVPLVIFDVDDSRAAQAAEELRRRGRQVAALKQGRTLLAECMTESGPGSVRLWRPHALLEEAIHITRAEWGDVTGRTALDVACGTGRDAVSLALAGFKVTAIDILPDALQRCADMAARSGVSIHTECMDVENHGLPPHAEFDLVCCFNFLHRPLMPALAAAVRPGGFVVYETFVHPQVEKYGKPARASHVLQPGELRSYFADWRICVFREDETGPRRIAASLVAQKPTDR